MRFIKQHGHLALSVFIAFVFIQSLFFKFTDSPETTYIFVGKLEPWAASLGWPGLFSPGGVFSAKVIGSGELVASCLVLFGAFVASRRVIQLAGALLGLGIISGAIFFHLFTPLGIAVQNADGSSDGGQLFGMACGVWVSCLVLAWLRRDELLKLMQNR